MAVACVRRPRAARCRTNSPPARSCRSRTVSASSPSTRRGAVVGTPELAAVAATLDKAKPVYAFTSGKMCSAAYWIASHAPSPAGPACPSRSGSGCRSGRIGRPGRRRRRASRPRQPGPARRSPSPSRRAGPGTRFRRWRPRCAGRCRSRRNHTWRQPSGQPFVLLAVGGVAPGFPPVGHGMGGAGEGPGKAGVPGSGVLERSGQGARHDGCSPPTGTPCAARPPPRRKVSPAFHAPCLHPRPRSRKQNLRIMPGRCVGGRQAKHGCLVSACRGRDRPANYQRA